MFKIEHFSDDSERVGANPEVAPLVVNQFDLESADTHSSFLIAGQPLPASIIQSLKRYSRLIRLKA
jgi:hypothetical protein